MRDTFKRLQELDHFTREQIVRDSEFASIFPRAKWDVTNKSQVDSLFPTITGNDIYGYCLLVTCIITLISKVLSWV